MTVKRVVEVEVVDVDEFQLIPTKPLVEALDDAFGGYYNELAVHSAIEMDADCADLFPVLHETYAGLLTRREDAPYFAWWLEAEIERNPAILTTIYDQTHFGPRIITRPGVH